MQKKSKGELKGAIWFLSIIAINNNIKEKYILRCLMAYK